MLKVPPVAAFGIARDRIDELLGTEVPAFGFIAASLVEGVARSEFAHPERAGGAVLLKLNVRQGTPAA